ncbi:terpene synthase family protein [Streptomyces sp. NBC_00207]|uniref:terpene synthase family protein n=1 Tax=Streptomyces sp. NBC_00207 TaxID=2903635 RepID=UPI00288761C1|nr:terpene synthase family protein [Streptomyces sp. DSM 41633]
MDDLIVERFKRSRDPIGARAFLDRLGRVAADPRAADPSNPVERGLADLMGRTCAGRDTAWRERLTGWLPNVFDDALWEVDNLASGRIPDPVDYIGMRRRSGGAGWAAQLVERALHLDLPPAVHEQPAMQRLHEAFEDVVDLHNDLVSYRRETEYEQDVSNHVVVTAHFLTTHALEAAVLTRRLLQERLSLFDRLATETLTTEASAGRDIARCLQGLKDWLAGDYAWHEHTTRYRPEAWQHQRTHPTPVPARPNGLGTAAADLPRLLRQDSHASPGRADTGVHPAG